MREKERAMMMMSSQCLLPNWNLNLKQRQRQEQVDEQEHEEDAANSSKLSHNQLNHPPSSSTTTTSHLLPMYAFFLHFLSIQTTLI